MSIQRATDNALIRRICENAGVRWRIAGHHCWSFQQYMDQHQADEIDTVSKIVQSPSRREIVRSVLDIAGTAQLRTTYEAIVIAHSDLFAHEDVCKAVATLAAAAE